MILRKLVLDTNIYVDWFNKGLREELMIGPGFVRYLSAVVQMELRVGATMLPARRALDQVVRAYRTADRIVAPDSELFDHAGRVLQRLREAGREIRRDAPGPGTREERATRAAARSASAIRPSNSALAAPR